MGKRLPSLTTPISVVMLMFVKLKSYLSPPAPRATLAVANIPDLWCLSVDTCSYTSALGYMRLRR